MSINEPVFFELNPPPSMASQAVTIEESLTYLTAGLEARTCNH